MAEIFACLGMGSNLGPSSDYLLSAWRQLEQHPSIKTLRLSSPYRSQPLDMDSTHWFINAAGLIRTNLSPVELLAQLHCIEHRLHRHRSAQETDACDRTLDLDLLLYGDLIIESPNLIVPHPRMLQRRFVLVPLAEIAPDLIHPLANRSIRSLLHSLEKELASQPVEKRDWPLTRLESPFYKA